MRLLLLILALLISSVLLSQQSDTAFLYRNVRGRPDPIYHAIFIDKGTQFRNELTSFSFKQYDSTTYFDQLSILQPLVYPKYSRNNFPARWIPLHSLKGNYYLYYPDELGAHFQFEMTDSTTIDYTMEGPNPSRLNRISFPSPTHAVIDRSNVWGGKSVEIKLVDTVKGIAVFTFGPTKYIKESTQYLMVDAAKAYLFPVMVNYCLTQKTFYEYSFDKINFKDLLK